MSFCHNALGIYTFHYIGLDVLLILFSTTMARIQHSFMMG